MLSAKAMIMIIMMIVVRMVIALKSDDIIELQLYYGKGNLLEVNIMMGTLEQSIHLNMDLNCPMTIMSSFNEIKSSTYETDLKEIDFDLQFYSVKGILSNDYAKVGSLSINRLPFVLSVDVNGKNINGVLGLSRLIQPRDSIVHLAYDMNLISKRSFIIKYDIDTRRGGLLILGPIHIAHAESFYYYNCPIKNKNSNWNCQLNHVIMGRLNIFSNQFNNNDKGIMEYSIDLDKYDHYVVNSPIQFSLLEEYIYVPLRFLNWIRDHYFIEEIHKNNCRERRLSDDIRGIECNRKGMEGLEMINLGFEGFFIILDKHFYYTSGTNYNNEIFTCAIVYKEEYNSWLFGTAFMRHHRIVFDYDLDEITFHSPNYIFAGKVTNEKESLNPKENVTPVNSAPARIGEGAIPKDKRINPETVSSTDNNNWMNRIMILLLLVIIIGCGVISVIFCMKIKNKQRLQQSINYIII